MDITPFVAGEFNIVHIVFLHFRLILYPILDVESVDAAPDDAHPASIIEFLNGFATKPR